MATVGNLRMMVTANIDGFTSALRKASDIAGRFTRQFNTSQLLGSALGGTEAKIAALSSTMRNMVSETPYIGGALGAAATAGGEFVEFLVRSTKEMATNIKLADRLGMDYNDLTAVSKKSGMAFDEVAMKLNKMNIVIGQSQMGGTKGDEALAKLEKFGLGGIGDLTGSERLRKVADAYKTLDNPMKRAAFLQELIGKGVLDLAKALKDGGEGLDEYRGHFENVNKGQQEQIKTAAMQMKLLDEISGRAKVKATVLGAPVLASEAGTLNEGLGNIANAKGFWATLGAGTEMVLSMVDGEKQLKMELKQTTEAMDHWREEQVAATKNGFDFAEYLLEVADKVTDLEKKLKMEADTLGMTSGQIEIYKAKLAGATDEQLKSAKATVDYIEEMKNAEKFMGNWDKALEDFEKHHPHNALAAFGKFESFSHTAAGVHLPSALEMGSSAAISAQAHFDSQRPMDLQQQIAEYVRQTAQTEKDHLRIGEQILEEMQRQGVDIP